MAWTKAHCPEGFDKNPPEKKHTDAQKEEEWAFVVKMTLICRDLMLGNPKLAEMGWEEESDGPQRHFGRLPGPAHVVRLAA